MKHLLLALIAAGVLALTGCGTNKFLGLDDVSLLPDLVASDIKQTDSAGLGGDVEFEIVISNIGGAGSRGFRVQYVAYHVLDITIPPSPCSPTVLGAQAFQDFDGLDSSDAILTTVNLKLPEPYDEDSGNGDTGCNNDHSYAGTWYIDVIVDYDEDIDEGDSGGEDNNVTRLFFEVSPSDSDGDPEVLPTKPIAN